MAAIFEGVAALLVVIVVLFSHLIAVVAELVGWVLAWVCAPFWSDGKKQSGLSERWKLVSTLPILVLASKPCPRQRL